MHTHTIQISRIMITFLGMLVLATLSGGAAYQSALNLLGGHGDWANVVWLLLSLPLFGFAMLVLRRIVYLTMPRHARGENAK